MQETVFSEGIGKWKVRLTLIKTTPRNGIIAILEGGEEPHVGAVAIGIPAPIVHYPTKVKATISVYIALLQN